MTKRFGIKGMVALTLCALLLVGGTAMAATNLLRPEVTMEVLDDGTTQVAIALEEGEEFEGTFSFRQTEYEDGTMTKSYSFDDGVTWYSMDSE